MSFFSLAPFLKRKEGGRVPRLSKGSGKILAAGGASSVQANQPAVRPAIAPKEQNLNSPGCEPTLLYISQRWDRDVGGGRRSQRPCRFGDDPPLCAFEPLSHTGWVVSTEPRRRRQRWRLRRRWRFRFAMPPQSSSFAIATRYRRDAPDGLRHPSQATGTAGRLRSGDNIASIHHDLRRHDPRAEMCVRGWV